MLENFSTLLNQTYFGSTAQQYLYFSATVILSILAGKLVYAITKSWGRKLTAKTRSKLDDVLLDILEEPLVFVIFLGGLFTGFQFLSPDPFIESSFHVMLQVLFIVGLTWLSLRVIDKLIDHFVVPLTRKTRSKLDDQLIPLMKKLSKVSVLAIAFIMVLDKFGYNVGALIAGLGIGGIAVAMAAKDTLGNMFAGLSIFADQPFQVGDHIQLGELEGTVKKVGLRSTRIEDFSRRLITIPNSQIADARVINVSYETARRVDLYLGLVYQTSASDLMKAIDLVKKIVRENKGTEDECRAIFKEFGDSALKLWITYYIIDLPNKFNVMHDINLAIKREFEAARLEFAYPTQTVYLAKGGS